MDRQLGTILVVEDETFINMFVSEELEEAGYTVLTAGNADQAIALLETHDVRCIFTDIDMPGSMDGLKLAAAVRNRWPPADIIITDCPDRPSSIVAPNRNITKAESATAPPATSPSNAAGSIEGDRGLVLLDEIARIVDLLQSDSICPREGLIAGKIPRCLVEHRLIMRHCASAWSSVIR